MTTIHTRQLQQYARPNQQQLHKRQLKTSNNRHETNWNTTCTKGKITPVRQYCVQFLVIVSSQSLIHSRFHPSPSLLITYYLLLQCRSQRPRGPRRGSEAVLLLAFRVRFPPVSWMSVVECCSCCQSSFRRAVH
jgi:hypothetical protein